MEIRFEASCLTSMNISRLLPLTLTFCSIALSADQIIMMNGDRFTGAVIKLDGKNLVLKSDYAGTITVPWDAVVGISSTEPLNFTLRDGQLVVGQVTTSDNKFVIQTRDAGTVAASRDAVQMVRSQAEQAEADRYRNPRITDLWTGLVDVGYAAARGNSTTNNLNVSANATRATPRDKIEVNFTSLYASNKVAGQSIVTANAMRGGLGYSLNVNPRTFAFGSLDLEYDQFQNLDLRFAPAGGFGFHALKTETALFDIFGGASLNREFFSNGLNRTSGEMLGGEELTYKLSAITSLHERLSFYPNITRTGDYRANFDLSSATTLKKWLAWQVTASDRLLSDPLPGRKRNDLILTTGLRITFAKN
jgi:putative salt-induced outer membrane protein